jgi:hypothetical protein
MSDPISDSALARAVAVVLLRAELRLGLPLSHAVATSERIPHILQAAQRGGLPGRLYELVWLVPQVDAPITAAVGKLDHGARQALVGLLQPELTSAWLPDPRNEPQCKAYYSHADLMLFGGQAGGGKSDLLAGTALTQHARSVIFRRQATELGDISERIIQLAGRDGWNGVDKILRRPDRIVELGHLEKPGSELTWMGGLGHDFIGFDEARSYKRQRSNSFLAGSGRPTPISAAARSLRRTRRRQTRGLGWLSGSRRGSTRVFRARRSAASCALR